MEGENGFESVSNNQGSAEEVNASNYGSGSIATNTNLGEETLTSKMGNMNLGAEAVAQSENNTSSNTNNIADNIPDNMGVAKEVQPTALPEVKTNAPPTKVAKRKPSEVQANVRSDIQAEADLKGYNGPALKPQLKYIAPLASLKDTNTTTYQQKLERYVESLIAGNKNPNLGFVRTNAQKAKTERNKQRRAEKKAAELAAKGLPVPPVVAPSTKVMTKKATKKTVIPVSRPFNSVTASPSNQTDIKRAVYLARKEMIRAVKDTMYGILKAAASPRKTHKTKISKSKSKTRSK